MGCKPERFFGKVPGHTRHLIQNSSRSNNRDPSFRSTFTLTHTNFSRFFRKGFVGENAYPEFSAPLDMARHGNTRSFDLFVADRATLDGLQAKLPEIELTASSGQSPHFAFLFFSILYLFRAQHGLSPVKGLLNDRSNKFRQRSPLILLFVSTA
jgi:hypothetical protein